MRFINPAIAVCAFLGTCILLRNLLPEPAVEVLTPKLDFFRAHGDEFDTLFVGSSRFYRQIEPAIFDHVTRRRGLPTHSFNFGLDAMFLPETSYVLDKILAQQPKGLKWVFIEFDDLQLPTWQYSGTQRQLYWHDWRSTSSVLRKLLNLDVREKPKRRLQRLIKYRESFANHLGSFAKNFTNVGSGSLLLQQQVFPEQKPASMATILGRHRDGFYVGDEHLSGTRKRAYEQALADARRLAPRAVDRYAEEAFRSYARKVRQCGAIPIFIAPPAVADHPAAFFARDPSPGAVWAFNDYEAFSQLFRAEVRANEGHLNKAGAAEFTCILARRFADDLASGALR